jgi:formylglycine-generating enzyme required for sulfatase activity
MTWIGADAYCKAQGKRLPSEAQWEAAARGPDGERFPWGDEPATCKKAIIKGPAGRACGVNKIGETPWKGRPFIVGSRPAYRYGLHDMAGNSWEYVSDWASPSFEACGAACQGIDPLGPCAGQDTCEGTNSKVVKGGSWYYPAEYAEAVFRREQPPNNRPFHHLGFRCAASIDEATALHGVPARANAPKVGMKNPDAKL